MSQGVIDANLPYVYQKLSDQNEVRLLALLPGRFNDPIRSSLSPICLDNEPVYEALSYTWGSLEKLEILVCDDLTLYVTKNLYEGLRRLRRVRSIRVIWVDALCINQDDIDERNQQILYMARIYRQAKQVVIWLGENSDHADLVPFSGGETHWVFSTESNHTRQLPLSWLQHFNRPWFLRVWIIQEVVLARKLTVIHGRKKIPWRDFARIAEDFRRRSPTITGGDSSDPSLKSPGLVDTISMVSAIENWQQEYRDSDCQGLVPYNLLESTGACKATDIRDKIYALLGLFPEHFRELVRPNYADSIDQILIDLAGAFVREDLGLHAKSSQRTKTNRHLSILAHCRPANRREGLPSWVPDMTGDTNTWGVREDESSLWGWYDWRTRHKYHRPMDDLDQDGVPIVAIVEHGRVLSLQGLRICRIKYINEAYIDCPSGQAIPYEALLKCLHSWYSVVRGHPQFKDNHLDRLPQFMDAVMDQLSTPISAKTTLKGRAHVWNGLAFMIKHNILQSTPQLWSSDSSSQVKRKRRFAKTSKAIGNFAKFRKEPIKTVKNKIAKLTNPEKIILRKDHYPTVPAASDADSTSVEGNISSHKSTSDSISSPFQASVSSIHSDDRLPTRFFKRTLNLSRKKVTQPVKVWTAFAWSEYKKRHHKADDDMMYENLSSAGLNTDEDLALDSGDEADFEAEEAAADTESLDGASDDGMGIPANQSDDDLGLARSPSTSALPKDLNHKTALRYMHTNALIEPPVQGPWVRQERPSYPCRCNINDPDGIDYTQHLTAEEDAQIFDPKDAIMNEPQAKSEILVRWKLDKAINHKQFGYIELLGRQGCVCFQ